MRNIPDFTANHAGVDAVSTTSSASVKDRITAAILADIAAALDDCRTLPDFDRGFSMISSGLNRCISVIRTGSHFLVRLNPRALSNEVAPLPSLMRQRLSTTLFTSLLREEFSARVNGNDGTVTVLTATATAKPLLEILKGCSG